MSSQPSEDLTESFAGFLRDYYHQAIGELAAAYPRDQTSLAIDWQDLYQADHRLADDVLDNPRQCRRAAEQALHNYDLPIDVSGWNPSIRFTNLPEDASREIGHFRAADESQLISVNGQVTRKTVSRPRLDEAVFTCQRCGHDMHIPQSDDGLQEPYQCEACERQGPFQLDVAASEKTDHQRLRVQTPPERAADSSTDSLDIDLEAELVDTVDVGQRVTVATLLEARPESGQDAGRLLEWRANADAIKPEDTTFDDLDVADHEDRIQEIAAGTPFEDIVESVNPSHMGDETVKLAIGLQLFGGVRREQPDGSIRRGDGHILLVGDPGCGKSAFLQWARKLSPRSIYTSGKASTAAGLTAACVPDDFGEGGYTIEGGAMVKANGGIAAVDELDKMEDGDRGAMFEALAEQTISVQKAGIEATLPAQTRLLAAANPRKGRFDHYEPIAEQIDLDPALISRFDLIFTFQDAVDPELDAEIAAHMNRATRAAGLADVDDTYHDAAVEPAIEPDVMRAYIAYARQNYDPVLSEAASDAIEDAYLRIRTANDGEDSPIPTTPRTVEALQRLAEASARVRLSNTVTPEDVERAMEPLMEYLTTVGVDPDTDEIDTDIVETGVAKSQRQRMNTIEAIIRDLHEEHPAGAPYAEIVERAWETGEIPEEKVEHAIARLCESGEAYEAVADKYQMTTSGGSR